MPKVLVPLAQGCEEMEAITITDLLVRAEFDVITAGLDAQPVIASRGTKIIPQTQISEIMQDEFDLIVLPGGLPGAIHLRDDENIQKLIKTQAKKDKWLAAICAAPKALAQAGVLDNKVVTCFPGALDGVSLNNTQVNSTKIEIDGHVITSRGPGTAMDFSLMLTEVLAGKEKRQQVEKTLVR